jgi:hypothetical protein
LPCSVLPDSSRIHLLQSFSSADAATLPLGSAVAPPASRRSAASRLFVQRGPNATGSDHAAGSSTEWRPARPNPPPTYVMVPAP